MPNWVTIDGKQRCLRNRKYCLICSPFGSHNRKRIHLPSKEKFLSKQVKICKSCGCEFTTKSQTSCGSCMYKKQRAKRKDKVYSIVGTDCWCCGYDKSTSILDFHHMDPKQKQFGLNLRTISSMKWEKVWAELQKCASICCRCHREHHAGLLEVNLEEIYLIRWNDIREKLAS